MGQQQLLLLVLSAIIVGVSIVIGINMFSSSAIQANQDAVLQDCLNIAARAQEWFRRPAILSGGNRSFEKVTFKSLNIDSTNANVSEAFSFPTRDSLELQILGVGTEGTPLRITVVVSPSQIVSTEIVP